MKANPCERQSINDNSSPAQLAMASTCANGAAMALIGEAATADHSEVISHYPRASEDHLVATAQSGDQRAFVELCRRHSPAVRRRILSIVRNQEDADDALQDTLLRAYTHLSTFRRSCKFSSWITTIGVNTALMVLRRRRTRQEIQPDLTNAEGETLDAPQCADHSLNPEGLYVKHQIVLVVRREVQKLRPSLRAAIREYYGSDSSLEELAKALDISMATAKSRLMRGRRKLRWSLGRRGIVSSGV
jgi:RNA polymerase sigma-70 factor, ECF subfamily